MSKNSTTAWLTNFDFRNEDSYIGIISRRISTPKAQSVERTPFYLEVPVSNPLGGNIFPFIFFFFLNFFHIQMFFYTIINFFIILIVNVNKSRNSAGSLSLMEKVYGYESNKDGSTSRQTIFFVFLVLINYDFLFIGSR
jgi:hypothetical protein